MATREFSAGTRSGGLRTADGRNRAVWKAPLLASRSLHFCQLLHVDPFQPFLEIFRVLVLRFDSEDIALRDHQPERAVFAFILECLETGHALDRERLRIALRRGR